MRRRAGEADQVSVNVAERLAPYELLRPSTATLRENVDGDLVEKAATFLVVMPRNQHRQTIEELLAPNDPEKGRRAVDALIEAAYASEDDAGRLRLIA